MLTVTLLLALGAAAACALGGRRATPAKTVTYGEFPGITDFQKLLVGKGTGWLNDPGSYPGMSEAQGLWAGSQPNAWAGGARLGEMLAPGWLSQTPEELNTIDATQRAAAERQARTTRQGLLMDFGSRGHQFSTPMVSALNEADLAANQALEGQIAGRRYGEYGQRLAMLPGLIQMALNDPYRAAQMLGENGQQMVQTLLALATGGRGQMQIIPGTSSEPGWLEQLLNTAVKAELA